MEFMGNGSLVRDSGQDVASPATAKSARLPLMRWPRGRAVEAFRLDLERALIAQAGSIGLAAASRVHTACVALRRHLQVEKHLRDGEGTLTIEQWQGLADRSLRYKDAVDKCLTSLGLDVRPESLPKREAWKGLEQAVKEHDARVAAARPDAPAAPLCEATANPAADLEDK